MPGLCAHVPPVRTEMEMGLLGVLARPQGVLLLGTLFFLAPLQETLFKLSAIYKALMNNKMPISHRDLLLIPSDKL